MTNIEIPRELVEVLASSGTIGADEMKQLNALLNPEPATVRDFVDAGRGDEIKPGMWVEYTTEGELFMFVGYDSTSDLRVLDIQENVSGILAKFAKPRFDLRPAFAPDGEPFPIVDAEPEPEPAKPETPDGGLFGRWATHHEHGRVLLIQDRPDDDGDVCIRWVAPHLRAGIDYGFVPLSSLTFDPATLTTEQDYADAPDGTIVERKNAFTFIKDDGVWWFKGEGYNNDDLCCVTREVVRFGRG